MGWGVFTKVLQFRVCFQHINILPVLDSATPKRGKTGERHKNGAFSTRIADHIRYQNCRVSTVFVNVSFLGLNRKNCSKHGFVWHRMKSVKAEQFVICFRKREEGVCLHPKSGNPAITSVSILYTQEKQQGGFLQIFLWFRNEIKKQDCTWPRRKRCSP
jgi:hypothetical protein